MILIDTQKEEFSRLKDIRVFGRVSHEDRYNGNLLVIGLGGAGAEVVLNLKGMLMDNITPSDNIHFLMVDSDIPAMERTIEDSKDYIGFNAMEVMSVYRPNIANVLENGITQNPIHENLAPWMAPDFPALTVDNDGAHGNRQIGRLMFSNAYEDIRMVLFDKLEDVHFAAQGNYVDVIIVSSVAGGTGSGILTDLTYNIRAYGKAKKWANLRVGGCLLMPDVLFGNRDISSDSEKMFRMMANGYATMKEVDYFMKLSERDDAYSFESTTHKMVIRENLFDACTLVSGKKDDQGYLPESTIYMDTAKFLYKLSCNKYIGNSEMSEDKKLLRDVFFENEKYSVTNWKMEHAGTDIANANCYYKVVSEADYKIPIREIENICEYEVFTQAYKLLFVSPFEDGQVIVDIKEALRELDEFLNAKPGEDINLSVSGLVRFGQFTKPVYKAIKKNQDGLREDMARKVAAIDKDVPAMIKSVKNKIMTSLDNLLVKYMKVYGPYAVIDIIGAPTAGAADSTKGMIAEVKKLRDAYGRYTPTGEFERIIDSIKEIVAKRFFTFPSAKRETENGYYDACVKEAIELERGKLMEAIDSQDLFGDILRWLQQRAERFDEIYAQFGEDLKNSINDLASEGKYVTNNILKTAARHEFLPYDYVNTNRIRDVKNGIVNLMTSNESNIDNGRVVPVRDEMEKIYRELFSGIGAYGPEKMLSVAFADGKITEHDINVMFGSKTNDRRDEALHKAAKAFVNDIQAEKELCVLRSDYKKLLLNKKYISVPNVMPYFSKAVKEILMGRPYYEKEDAITLNPGEIEISIDDMFIGVPALMMECLDEMRVAYESVDTSYKGLHIDEVNRDMRSFPNLM